MKIKPIGSRIQIEIDEPKAGALETSSLNVAKEKGKVVAIGQFVNDVKVGDEILFKGWAVDIITDNGKRYYFIDEESKGLCAVLK
jgi:co-chaperonin GroES (HSP10)